MIYLIKSFQARAQGWIAHHFDLTPYGWNLKKLKNRHEGQRCFLIGNGPSLRADDLTKLHDNQEICFAFNRIYNIFDQTPWRPTYYISQDEKMLQGCMDIVDRSELGMKLIPINLCWYHGVHLKNVNWFYIKSPKEENGKPLEFSDNPTGVIFNSSTGMYTAAQFAAYMGFSEIYLIGVDHHFRISQNNSGEIVVDNSVKDYFSEKYNEDKDKLYIPNTERSTLTYVAMKEQCENRGITVYNSTRGGKLDVFQRVDFDSIF